MPDRIDNDTWAAQWSVPVEVAEATRYTLQRELYHTWNSPRTQIDTGTIYLFPGHLQRPGATGMYLLEKMGTDLTPLPKELQFLISSTSCQHRVEFFGVPSTERAIQEEFVMGVSTIPCLVYYDGRAMYLGCCQGLGIAGGRYTHTEGEDIREDERGRAQVEFSIPADWRHVGLLPVKDLPGSWWWPDVGGCEVYTTWADLCEIRFARSMGWHVEVMEKITWPEARPLDLWAQRLSKLYLKAKGEGNDVLTSCYRSIALHTIGRLHNLGYRDDRRTVAADDPRATFDAVESLGPDGATIRTRERVDKPERECHPEWSAAIWSKTHLRVAKALMSVPRETVLAVRGDAIYLTGDPGWGDDGRCGILRWKGQWDGPLLAPRNWNDLKALTSG